MEFSVKIEGLDKLKRTNAKIVADTEKELNRALFASAKRVEAEAKRSIASGPKTGRIYKRRSVVHQASAPGEAPASDTGRLLNSINSSLDKGKQMALVIAGRGTAKYAAMLEYGTKKMAARPFMFPALEKNKKWIRARLAKAVNKAVRKAGK